MFSKVPSLSALKAPLVLSLALCVAAPAPSAAPIPTGCGTERLDRMVGQMILVGFPQRAAAAFFAISLRCSGVSLLHTVRRS